MAKRDQAEILRELQSHIARLEEGSRHPRSAGRISSGFAGLDRLLPRQGFAGGSLVEWLGSGDGSGGMTLALAVGGRIIRDRGVLVLVGDAQTFFPPAAAGLGVPLERMVVVRTGPGQRMLWGIEQALRCEGIAVTLGRLDRAPGPVLRRLQLAAETGGGLGFLVRPGECRGETPWGDARLLVQGIPGEATPGPPAWRLRVELLYCRGGRAGGTAEVEVGDETNHVHLAPELARPAKRCQDP